MRGGPIVLRELLAQARRPRTYVFQTVFLAALVVALLPAWPALGAAGSGARAADRGRMIFEWGAYMQVILLALLAPALTANAVTDEKRTNTLDLLLLTGTGAFAIAWGKFLSRLFNLCYLLFLTTPLLFALLTLGGVDPTWILAVLVVLVAFATFATGLGVLLSTVLPRATGVLLLGYTLLAGLLAAPAIAQALHGGGLDPRGPLVSPLHDLIYLFHPTWFVAAEPRPTRWWIAPLWLSAAGVAMAAVAGLVLPVALEVERLAGRAIDAFDRATYLALAPRVLLRKLTGQAKAEDAPAQHRPIGALNPIYWKETNVDTIGRFRTWWRVNLITLLVLTGSWAVFSARLGEIRFHQVSISVITALLVLLSTVIAATTVSREREDGTLDLLATTPLECSTYVPGKVRGIARNMGFFLALPFLHVAVWAGAGVVHPATLVYLALGIPVAVAASIVQGILVSLLFPTTLRAIVAAIVVVALEAALPSVCCVPTFNLPLLGFYMVESAVPDPNAATGALAGWAKGGVVLFSALTHLGFLFVLYSLIRSDFDRYVGRGA